jgi:enoyl-CoA hydratase/carnithine racemase
VRFEEYQDRFESVAVRRSNGIIEVTLHTGGGSLMWGPGPHRELSEAFEAIGSDPENRVVILTGAGDSFCADRDDSMSTLRSSPDGWNRIYWEGKRLLETLLAIEVPVISAINGPALHHAELPVICDIVLASDTTVFQDHAHFHSGVVPGDGVQVIWPLVLGPNRGRYFLLTGQVMTAAEAHSLGAVSEVLPAVDRAATDARGSVLARRAQRADQTCGSRRGGLRARTRRTGRTGGRAAPGGSTMTVEVICEACGAIVEAPDRHELVARAREHTLDAHAYNIPAEHVLAVAHDIGEDPEPPGERT